MVLLHAHLSRVSSVPCTAADAARAVHTRPHGVTVVVIVVLLERAAYTIRLRQSLSRQLTAVPSDLSNCDSLAGETRARWNLGRSSLSWTSRPKKVRVLEKFHSASQYLTWINVARCCKRHTERIPSILTLVQ